MEYCCNKVTILSHPPRGRPRDRNDPRLTINMRKTITAATEATLVLFQVALNHPYKPELSSPVPTDGAGVTDPPAGTGTALVAHALTAPPPPQTATPTAIGSDKKIQNMHDH